MARGLRNGGRTEELVIRPLLRGAGLRPSTLLDALRVCMCMQLCNQPVHASSLASPLFAHLIGADCESSRCRRRHSSLTAVLRAIDTYSYKLPTHALYGRYPYSTVRSNTAVNETPSVQCQVKLKRQLHPHEVTLNLILLAPRFAFLSWRHRADSLSLANTFTRAITEPSQD
jgi:hypothetical protein